MSDTPILPAHIEDTVQSIARLHAEHYLGLTQHRCYRPQGKRDA